LSSSSLYAPAAAPGESSGLVFFGHLKLLNGDFDLVREDLEVPRFLSLAVLPRRPDAKRGQAKAKQQSNNNTANYKLGRVNYQMKKIKKKAMKI
jgi:hypothetical protein